MKVFLIILFGGQLGLVDGFEPRWQPDLETCQERAAFANDYLKTSHPELNPSAECVVIKG